jgi:hypothetical protein
MPTDAPSCNQDTPPRPQALPVHVSGIPHELRQRDQWIVWRYTWKPDEQKWDKPPREAQRGVIVDGTDSKNWAPFATANTYMSTQHMDGLGYCLSGSDPYTIIDLDECRDPTTGALDPAAVALLEEIGGYWEVSPSGAGLRGVVRATLPGPGRNRPHLWATGQAGRIELYSRYKYLTMTGHVVRDVETIPEAQAAIEGLYASLAPERTNGHATEHAPTTAGWTPSPSLADDDVLIKAGAAKNAAAFLRLWGGDARDYPGDEGQPDDSRADAGLLERLAFYTQDRAQLDRLLRRSGLYRAKWERDDYRARTLDYVLGRLRETWQPGGDGLELVLPSRNGPAAAAPMTLAQVVRVFRRWLYLPDRGPLYAVLGTVAANQMDGDPVWLMLVGASSGGKTEILNAVTGLPHVHAAATLTEGALLSGTSRKDKDKTAKGGLLREIGAFGILCLKDFTSILSMNRDPRAALLAALRELYDGAWTRHVGIDGGRTLHWAGKLGLVAGCTTTIDGHHTVMATMGERFLLCRLPELNAQRQGERALENTGHERQMRAELGAAVAGLFAGLALPETFPPLRAAEATRLVALASLAARTRSPVERDGRTHEIELIPDAEAPARIAQALRRLYGGLRAIGLPERRAWQVITRCGLDCMPKLRRGVFMELAATDAARTTQALAAAVDYPTVTARRALEDLAAHGVVKRESQGEGRADLWSLAPWARTLYAVALGQPPPEKSVDGKSAPAEQPSFTTLHRTCGDFSVRGSDEPEDDEVPW